MFDSRKKKPLKKCVEVMCLLPKYSQTPRSILLEFAAW